MRAAICTAWGRVLRDVDRPKALHRASAMEVIYKHKKAELPEIPAHLAPMRAS